MRASDQIRQELLRLQRELPTLKRKYAMVITQTRIDTLRWVLGEEGS